MRRVYQNILIIVVGFCTLHLVFAEKSVVFLAVALTVLISAAISENAAVVIEKSWLWIGEKMGMVTSPLILYLIYFLILTPIAFLSRIGSKDPLQLKAPNKTNFIFKHHRYTSDDLKNPW